MSSRGRKRAARRKRKRRSSNRTERPARSQSDIRTATQGNGAGPAESNDLATEAEAHGISRSELKNERAREQLEPLGEGERPLVVTVGAILAGLVAAITLGSYLAGAEVTVYVGGVETGSERPHIASVIVWTTLFAVMAIGMWAARYWAVLGFQAVLALLVIGASLTLLRVTSVIEAVVATLLLAGAGTLFWLGVKAMARIQLPDRD